MKKFKFHITSDIGHDFFMWARKKSDIAEIIHRDFGVPYEFIEKHLLIKNVGVEEEEEHGS